MSETVESTTQETSSSSSNEINLNGLFAFKVGMATIYENGEAIPVTVLKYDNWYVSQIKTKEKDGYTAVQLASGTRQAKNTAGAERGHLKGAKFENGALFTKELRQDIPEGISLGQKVALESLAKGDVVTLTSRSKGKGFQGVIKRHGHHGGPGSHGSNFHRRPGSMGCRTWPGRVKPGRKLPGHMGDRNITVKNVQIVDVIPSESVLMVKGPVPGAYKSLVKVVKE